MSEGVRLSKISVQELCPSATSEFLVPNPPTFKLPSNLSSAQLAIPHHECCTTCIDPECIVCLRPPFHWLQCLDQLSASSRVLSDLVNKFRKHDYNAIIRVIDTLNIKSFDREISLYLHFCIAHAYYELKEYTLAGRHISECKSIASGAGDTSLCCCYLGKVASGLLLHCKAAEHYREAALCYQGIRSSLAETFHLIQPSRSVLHRQSAHEFCLVNCFPQALEELTQAINTAQTKEECYLAHYDRGKLHQCMANHPVALDDFELACKFAVELGDCVAAKRGYKDACYTCVLLDRTERALHFFECSLRCVSVRCRRCFAGSEQRKCDLQWICDIIDRLSIYRAMKLIPRTYISELRNIRGGLSSQFQALLERYPVDCQEEEDVRPNVHPVVVEDNFPVIEPPIGQVVPFVELAESLPPNVLAPVDLESQIAECQHRLPRTLLPEATQRFPSADPNIRNSEQSLVEIQSGSDL